MHRGYINTISSSSAYTESSKDWYITLQQSSCYWYDLIINPPESLDTKENITSQLANLRTKVEKTIEKRFIYFFASRTKIRFDITRPPKYSFLRKRLTINLLIGRDQKRRKVKINFDDIKGQPLTPRVEVSERFIRIFHSNATSQTFSVHDFLQAFEVNMGIATRVHYVGITKDPSDRPLNRKHRGITDTLYNVSNEENDFFIFINLFKVLSKAANDAYGLHFAVANSMIDEIQTHKEGLIVESALISYFDCSSQKLNREKERATLNRQIASLAKQNKIKRVSVHLEMEHPNEYFIFGSDSVSPALTHSFLYRYIDKKIEMESFSSEQELLAHSDMARNI